MSQDQIIQVVMVDYEDRHKIKKQKKSWQQPHSYILSRTVGRIPASQYTTGKTKNIVVVLSCLSPIKKISVFPYSQDCHSKDNVLSILLFYFNFFFYFLYLLLQWLPFFKNNLYISGLSEIWTPTQVWCLLFQSIIVQYRTQYRSKVQHSHTRSSQKLEAFHFI